jgi:hypothetical protein
VVAKLIGDLDADDAGTAGQGRYPGDRSPE